METQVNPHHPDIYLTHKPAKGRGCGKRKERKVYVTSGLAKVGGRPMEDFLRDPVRPWPTFSQGSEIVPGPYGFNDLVIYVGRDPGEGPGYPTAWDFFKEAQRFGASRAVRGNLEFENLTPRHYDSELGGMVGSRMVFVHTRAYYDAYYSLNYTQAPLPECRWAKRREGAVTQWAGGEKWLATNPGWHFRDESEPLHQCTHSLQDLAWFAHKDTGLIKHHLDAVPATFTVEHPSFSYTGRVPYAPLEEDYDEKNWGGPALFLTLPLTGIEFYKEANAEAAERAAEAGFPVSILPY